MQRFRVDLKTFLGLAIPTQTVKKQISSWFWRDNFGEIILGQNLQTFMIHIYIVLLYYVYDSQLIRYDIAIYCKEKFVILQSIVIIAIKVEKQGQSSTPADIFCRQFNSLFLTLVCLHFL